MAELGSGAVREVTSIRLSRAACMAIAMNADKKKDYHLGQIEQSGEIHLSDAIKKNLIPSDKWSGEVFMYNLDVVIAVGYRVNSYEATQFRKCVQTSIIFGYNRKVIRKKV